MITRESLLSTIAGLKDELALTEQDLGVLALESRSLASRVAAERARYGLDKVDVAPLRKTAAADQLRHEIAAAELAVKRAERKLAAAAGNNNSKTTQALKTTADQPARHSNKNVPPSPAQNTSRWENSSPGNRRAVGRHWPGGSPARQTH